MADDFECQVCEFTGDGTAAYAHRATTGHLIRLKATGDLRRAEDAARGPQRHDTVSELAKLHLDLGRSVWALIVAKCPTCGYSLVTAPEETGPPPACSYCARSPVLAVTDLDALRPPGPGRDSSEPIATALPRAPRLEPAAVEKRLAKLEQDLRAEQKMNEEQEQRVEDLVKRIEALEKALANRSSPAN